MSTYPRAADQVLRVRLWSDHVLSTVYRWRLDGISILPDEPCLLIGNHGFGTLTDLNVVALNATLHRAARGRASTTLVHQLAWRLGLGSGLRALGCAPASADSARAAFRMGHHVALFPGGDIEAAKSFRDRHRIIFSGRCGFARLALASDVPIVPIVTSGAGSTLLVLSSGEHLAQLLGLDRTLRLKALPVSLSLPWGLSVGVAGLLPYLPLPATLRTRVLDPIRPLPGEGPESLAARVHAAMQEAMDDLARDGAGQPTPTPNWSTSSTSPDSRDDPGDLPTPGLEANAPNP